MAKYTAVLLLVHKNASSILKMIEKNPSVRFYVHVDKKSESTYQELKLNIKKNLILLTERVPVFWGGCSQVQATLLLLKKANECIDNNFFHLMSSECINIIEFSDIEDEWLLNPYVSYLECRRSLNHEWRLKIPILYADTAFSRTFLGRVLTKLHKWLSFLLNFKMFEKKDYYFGSQWFSINRDLVKTILNHECAEHFFSKFKYVSCADEHAFQIFTKLYYKGDVINNNKRYIKFNGSSSPEYLSLKDIEMQKYSGNWFVRKVRSENIKKLLQTNE